MSDKTKYTPAEKRAAVLQVLKAASFPMGPTEIATRIDQPWCCYAHGTPQSVGQSAPITPVLRRLGAVRHQGGKYTAPVETGHE